MTIQLRKLRDCFIMIIMSGVTNEQLARDIAELRQQLRERPQRFGYVRTPSGLRPLMPESAELTQNQRLIWSVRLVGGALACWLVTGGVAWAARHFVEYSILFGFIALCCGSLSLMVSEFVRDWLFPDSEIEPEEDDDYFEEAPRQMPQPQPQRETPTMPRPQQQQRRKTLHVNGHEIEIDESKLVHVDGVEISLWRVQRWASIIAPPTCNTKATVTHVRHNVGVGHPKARALLNWLERNNGIDNDYLTEIGIDMLWGLCGFEPLPRPDQPPPVP